MRAHLVFYATTAIRLTASVFYVTDAAIDLLPLYALIGGFAVMAFIWFCATAAAVAARRTNTGSAEARSRTRQLIMVAAARAVVVTFAVTDVGLAARSRFSAGALLRAPCDARGWIGLFHVRELECIGQCRRFITTHDFLDDAGVAFCPAERPAVIGEDSYHHLFGGWWRWSRSW